MNRTMIVLSACSLVIAGTISGAAVSSASGIAPDRPGAVTRLAGQATLAISPNDVWVVGHQKAPGAQRATYAEHWDGTSWTVTTTPNPGDTYNGLNAISALATNDVWAVGVEKKNGAKDRALAMHWNGTSWTTVPMSQPRKDFQVELNAVLAISPDDVWAAGAAGDADVYPFAEHWDGTSWTIVSGLPSTDPGSIEGLAGASSNDVWLVGKAGLATYSAHWDGTSLTSVDTPSGTQDHGSLNAVYRLGSRDVWAAGFSWTSGKGNRPYLVHWDGTAWTEIPAAHVHTLWAEFNSLSGSGPDDLWAVGDTTKRVTAVHPLIQHFDGTSWQVVSTPYPKAKRVQLVSVSAATGSDAWAVGNEFFWHSYRYHWDGSQWSRV